MVDELGLFNTIIYVNDWEVLNQETQPYTPVKTGLFST